MIKKTTAIAASFLALLAPLDGAAEQSTPAGLAWLAGCWEHLDGSTREIWSGSQDGLHFGYSVTRKDGRVVAFEDLRITPGPSGPVYSASPNGGPATGFTLSSHAGWTASFDNAEHDFPQRIRYRRDGDRLEATISLIDDSEAMSFAMRRCTD